MVFKKFTLNWGTLKNLLPTGMLLGCFLLLSGCSISGIDLGLDDRTRQTLSPFLAYSCQDMYDQTSPTPPPDHWFSTLYPGRNILPRAASTYSKDERYRISMMRPGTRFDADSLTYKDLAGWTSRRRCAIDIKDAKNNILILESLSSVYVYFYKGQGWVMMQGGGRVGIDDLPGNPGNPIKILRAYYDPEETGHRSDSATWDKQFGERVPVQQGN